MRYFALFFFIIYLLFAYWQINDPDPIWWITLYLIPAYFSWRAFKNQYSLEVFMVLSVLYLAYAANLFQQMTNYEGFFTSGEGLSMKTANQELAREATGLCICVFSYITYSLYYVTRKKILSKKEFAVLT